MHLAHRSRIDRKVHCVLAAAALCAFPLGAGIAAIASGDSGEIEVARQLLPYLSP